MDKFRVCPLCSGEGTVVAGFASVWTQADRDEDPDGFEHMLRGGYDQKCPRCKGERVVLNSKAEQEEWEGRESDRRWAALESGDPEAYYAPY